MTSCGNGLRAGLVGAGYISDYHVAALRRAGVDIVGICDVDAARCKAAAGKAGIKAFASMGDLAAAGANVLHILTPPHTHAALALQALDLGCHVLVEKPLAEEVDDCDRLERRSAETGLKICVNHSLLYDPQVRKAVEVARSGKLGTVVSVDILRSSVYPPFAGGVLPPQYRAAGYPFRDIGVHCLYLVEALLGPIENVRADWKSLGGDPNLAYDEWRAQVRCKNGLGQFQLSWNVRPLQSQIIIQGTKAVMRVDLFLMFKALRKSGPLPKAAERIVNAMTDSLQPMIDVPRGVWGFLRKKVLPYHGLQDLVKDFYRSIAEGRPVPVSVSDARRVVRWTEQVARDAEAEYSAKVAPLKLSDEVPVLVTGASGALGGEIVKRLVGEGRRVRVLVRRPPHVISDGVEVALGDLGDPAAVDRAVRGARTVIHAGAAMKGGWVEHETGTVRGTQHVLDSCLKHGVRKLVHVSSMSVVQWAGGGIDAPVDENTPFEPRAEERGSYTRAKLQAEKLVTAFAKQHGLATVILRPGQIFGGKIPLLTPAVARRAGRRWVVLGRGDVRLPLVYMDDVVDAVMLALDGPLRGGEVIQLVDDYTPTQLELLAEVLGPGVKVTRVPRTVLFGMGKLSEFPLRLLKRPSPIAAYRLKSALSRRTFRSVNAELLGWKPRVGAREGIRRVAPPRGNTSGGATVTPPISEPLAGQQAVRVG